MGNLDFSANADQLKELAAHMAGQINVPTIGIGGGYAPIGTIISYMGTTAPQDYLACDGSTKNIADYPQLADFFEAQFGSKNYFGGDGTTTFAVPDLQGEFLRGTGTNSHANQGSGANVGEHQDASEIPSSFSYNNNVLYNSSSGEAGVVCKNLDTSRTTSGRAAVTGTMQADQGMMISVRPTNTSVLYCIKAVVAGDVYSTEERVVGTWIDGKPIYQKTLQIQCPTVSTDGTAMERRIDISNLHIAYAQIISGALDNGDSINTAWGSLGGQTTSTRYFRVGITIAENVLYVQTNRSILSNVYGYVTVQYTKTTD